MGRRGSKIDGVVRSEILELVASCVNEGASQAKACEIMGISTRSLQRWSEMPGCEDQRQGPKTAPANKLTDVEREKIIAVASSPEFCDMSPHQIVPKLADRGEFIASEASFYRVLKAAQILTHRGSSKPKSKVTKLKRHEALAPRTLFSWDITYLKSEVQGQYYFLYLFLDVFSRKIVGWAVHDAESTEYSSALLTRICLDEAIDEKTLVVHSDNGSPMKGATMLVTMQKLGVMPSFSRPSVSNDNPFSESLFKTLKYCPEFPSKPFESISAASQWVTKFVAWYNNEQLHSGIRFTTPASRHSGADKVILEKRKKVYQLAKEKHPERWSKDVRNWTWIDRVRLNWLKDEETSTMDQACKVS